MSSVRLTAAVTWFLCAGSLGMVQAGDVNGVYRADPDAVLLLHFDGDKGGVVSDSSVHGNHGDSCNLYRRNRVEGISGSAIDFPGSESTYVRIPHSPSMNPREAVTVEMWVCPRRFGGTLLEKPGQYKVWYYATTDLMVIDLVSSSAEKRLHLDTKNPLKLNQWQHLAWTYDGNQLEFYYNGVLTNKRAIGRHELDVAEQPLVVGRGVDAVIDEVRVSSVARRQFSSTAKILPPRSLAIGSAIVKLGEAQLTGDNCTIVLSSTASKCEAHAAEELRKYIRRISGVDLPIKTDKEKITIHMILIGNSEKLKGLGVTIDFPNLGEEGFVIRTVGDHLILAGGKERGTLYSIYTFLEEYLGCGWFMPAGPLGEVVPSSGTFSLAGIDRTEKPSFEWRALSGIRDHGWLVKNKLDPTQTGSGFGREKGDPAVFGSSGHSFSRLVPPKKYFLTHPEYFSLVDGKRKWDEAQICTSNPDVIRICAEALCKQMDERPDCKIFSLCQNDGRGWCQCEKCRALDVDENVMTDRLMVFANAVENLVCEEHPDKYLYTYAYGSRTQEPPRTEGLKPAENLIIQTTHYSPCCHSHPIAACERNARFKSQVERWAGLAPALYVYDYRVDYRQYLMPYPNCYAIAKDIPYYKRLGVKGLFYQGGGAFNHGLCHYLIAKLAWNSEADVGALIDRFFQRYFGKAAMPMKAYFRMLHDEMRDEDICVHLYSNPPAELFTPELLKKADEYFDEAERLADDRLILDRIERERLTHYFVKLATGRSDKAVKNKAGCYHGGPAGGEDAWREDLVRFIRLAQKHDVWQLCEVLPRGEIYRFVEQVSGMTVHDKAEFRYLAGDAAHGGKKCGYMRSGCQGAHPTWGQGRNILAPKTAYKFSAWIKVRDIKNVKVQTLRVGPAVDCSGPTITNTRDWTLVETTFTTPDVPSPVVTLYPAILSNEGEVWIDDVTLVEVSKPEKNIVANPGFERTLWIGAKKWRFPANRTFSWTEFSPIKDFLKDPKGYKIRGSNDQKGD